MSAIVVIARKYNNAFQPDTTNLLHVLRAGDPMHNGAEDGRANEHLDCGDEHVAPVAGKKRPTKGDRGEDGDTAVEGVLWRARSSPARGAPLLQLKPDFKRYLIPVSLAVAYITTNLLNLKPAKIPQRSRGLVDRITDRVRDTLF